MKRVRNILFGAVALLALACSVEDSEKKRFESLGESNTGVDFANVLTETKEMNYFTYPYLYMGGGVAIGDINNDDLPDLYFTGNMVGNKLFLNKGDMQFEDISRSAGVAGDDRWYTGVTMTDVNADGYMDIYVSVAGKDGNKENQLFLNNQDLTFTEAAGELGIADVGNSVQSVFFDYDRDGDLDLFVANYPITPFNTSNFSYRFLVDQKKPDKSDKLYRNEDGKFVDVTKEAGLLNFGLSISATVADYNNDGWEDIYVSNDFSTPDYFYFNNGDGTFTNQLQNVTGQTAFYGMGADASDFNNDGLIDFVQVDMAAQNNRRSKANMASMNPDLFWSTVNSGFHYQYMYNTLQLNRGTNEQGLPIFSNAAWLSGVSSTDWSWAPLLADFDNDGWKDLFVSNGTRREINNRDYFKKLENKLATLSEDELLSTSLNIPTEPIENFIFQNMDGISFDSKGTEWGLDIKGFSNGAAYADLDLDGDLDLVINNLDSLSSIYQNNSSELGESNYLRVKLEGNPLNTQGIGSRVILYAEGTDQHQHMLLSRGFQSSVEPIIHFGLGGVSTVDSVVVHWVDGTSKTVVEPSINQVLTIGIDQSLPVDSSSEMPSMFTLGTDVLDTGFYHQENVFNDYYYQVLLPHQMSTFGPALTQGDVNSDGLTDLFVGNGSGFAGVLYVQQVGGSFEVREIVPDNDAVHEDLAALFFDADGDGDNDLYVVSGGNEWAVNDSRYQDRLYLNQDGKFEKTSGVLPEFFSSGSCVIPHDIDNDGDIDLFVGGRLSPRNYPYPGTSHILINQLETGSLKFLDQTEDISPELVSIGMVTDGLWTDFDQDGLKDLIVVGEWMPISFFRYDGEKLENVTADYGYENSTGWWFSIDQGDFDNDGDNDLVVGNLGLNYKYQATREETFDIYASDFDENNSPDIVLGYYNEGTQFPVRGRQCSSEQIPAIQVAFKSYDEFAEATLEDIYGSQSLENSLHYQVQSFASVYLENLGYGNYNKLELPILAQLSPINDMVVEDINGDGNLDVVVAGNLYASEVETPRNDSGIGLLMLGDGKGDFNPVNYQESGILINHDSKRLSYFVEEGKQYLVSANNQGPLQIFVSNPPVN